jgi:hypothetical protein
VAAEHLVPGCAGGEELVLGLHRLGSMLWWLFSAISANFRRKKSWRFSWNSIHCIMYEWCFICPNCWHFQSKTPIFTPHFLAEILFYINNISDPPPLTMWSK